MTERKKQNSGVTEKRRKYTLGIASILCVMFLSVTYYVLRIVQRNNNLDNVVQSIGYLITGNFENSNKDAIEEFENKSQIHNYLVTSTPEQKTTISKAVYTTVGYESLSTKEEKTCYNLIKSNCNKISNKSEKSGVYPIETITVKNSKLTPYQIKKILYAVQNDNPDIFWISSNFSYQYDIANNTLLKINSIMNPNDQQAAIKRLGEKVTSILSKVSANASDYQKELYVHDYIVENCKYTYKKDNPKIYTSYGCLVENAAVCEGYSKSAQLLLNMLGIECSTVTGAKGIEPHMWNIVKIKKRWYHLDVTWDGSSAIGRYNYFNLDDNTIKKDHTINKQIDSSVKLSDKRYNFKLPECNSVTENFYEKNAVKLSSLNTKSENAIIKELTHMASKKSKYLYLKITSNYQDIKNKLTAQRPYEIFRYFRIVNGRSNSKNKINTDKLNYSENKKQNVLIIEVFY